MHTSFRIRQPYADIFLRCAKEFPCNSPARPERFIRKMKTHTGTAGAPFGQVDENGLEYKNPVICALGDSVTAGHFESLLSAEQQRQFRNIMSKLQKGASIEELTARLQKTGALGAGEIFDARESYIEKFRGMLIDKYELTSVSVINAGLAGDTLPEMIRRADRDVIRYDPDLILFNGALNWDDAVFGDASVFKSMLKGLVQKFKKETTADIILITPNGDLPSPVDADQGPVSMPTTPARCDAIREVAREENVCLADVRAVWDAAAAAGCPWEELLANKVNHPSVEGHEVYARVLMKLFEEPAQE